LGVSNKNAAQIVKLTKEVFERITLIELGQTKRTPTRVCFLCKRGKNI